MPDSNQKPASSRTSPLCAVFDLSPRNRLRKKPLSEVVNERIASFTAFSAV